MNHPPTQARGRRRGFSLVEVLISLTITATLLTATLTALDTAFKSYKVTTEGASTHVVSRMVITRLMTMLRTGNEFGPSPMDVLDATQNPVSSTFIEFTNIDNTATGVKQIVRLERRNAVVANGEEGPYVLWYVEYNYLNGTPTSTQERPIITGVTEATFTLEYDVGPRLKKATVDLTIKPNDFQDASMYASLETPTIRLVSSVSPRRLIEQR